jgi:hypothetical protein
MPVMQQGPPCIAGAYDQADGEDKFKIQKQIPEVVMLF